MTRMTRKLFSDQEIADCFALADGHVPDTARLLTDLGRGEVTAQLARYWCRNMAKPTKSAPVAQTPRVIGGGPKVLSLDIETSPIEGRVWGLFKQNVGLNQIVKDWNILSFCAKWLEDDEVTYQDLRDAVNIADDSTLVRALWQLLNEADIVVVQNGKRFDVPKINARFIALGLLPPSPYKIIDTLLIAKQQFGFTSKKLEYMTELLCTTKKRKHEQFPGMELWNQCLAGNRLAWEEMELYNIDDVRSMEELYLLMRPWFVGHPNVAIYFQDDEPKYRCPKCGSDHIHQDGVSYTQTGEYEKMHCQSCGGWSRGRYTRNSKETRNVLLSN